MVSSVASRIEQEDPLEFEEVAVFKEGTVSNSDITIYDYDLWNRLTWSLSSGKITQYGYNGEGRRTEKTVDGEKTRYLYEYDKVVLEVDGVGAQTARNVYGINLIARSAESSTLYYMYNGHADVVALLDINCIIQAQYYYDAFGNILEESGTADNPIRYAGYQYDEETGLYYLNARYYDSKIARFISEDTYRGDASDPLSLNLYTYCFNNPIRYVDPSGHEAANVSIFGNTIGQAQLNSGVTTGNLRDIVNALGGSVYYDDVTRMSFVNLNGYQQVYDLNTMTDSDGNSFTIIDGRIQAGVREYAKIAGCEDLISFYRDRVNVFTVTIKATNQVNPTEQQTSPGPVIEMATNQGTDNSTTTQGTWYDGVLDAAKNFILGVTVAGDNNLFFGAAQAIAGKTPQSDSTAFKVGKVVGDIGSLFVGGGAIAGGLAGEVGGVALDATGVGAIAGVPLNIAGAAAITYGATVVVSSAGNLITDVSSLMSGGGGSEGTGNAAKGAAQVAKIGDDVGNLGKLVKNPNLNVNWGNAREHALNRMTKNGVTQDMFESWVKNGKAIQQDSNTYLFLTKEGVAVVSKNGIPQTAYTSAQFKDHIIDAITQVYGK